MQFDDRTVSIFTLNKGRMLKKVDPAFNNKYQKNMGLSYAKLLSNWGLKK